MRNGLSLRQRRFVTATEPSLIDAEDLPPEQRLALAYTPAKLRPKFAALLAFDQRLARIAGNTSEPALGQMRLAWWRDILARPVAVRPQGDAVLDALGEQWAGSENELIALVDGWEVLVASEQIGPGELKRFAAGRSLAYHSLHPTDENDLYARIRMAATRYALADAGTHLSDTAERELFLKYGLEGSCPDIRLPRELRGLAVLEALALRSLKRSGRPLMEGRGAALTAFWAGLIGR